MFGLFWEFNFFGCGNLWFFPYLLLLGPHHLTSPNSTYLHKTRQCRFATYHEKRYKFFANSYNSIMLVNCSFYLLFIPRILSFDLMRLQVVSLMYLEYIKTFSYHKFSVPYCMTRLHIVP